MIGSVRARLTLAVAVVVGALAVTAALIAPRSVEQALVEDRLDAEVAAERAALDTRFEVVDRSGAPIGSPELTALFGPEIAQLIDSLDGTGILDELRAQRSDRRLVVSPFDGIVGEIDTDGRIRVESVSASNLEGPIVTGSRLEQLAVTLGSGSVFDAQLDLFADDGAYRDFIERLDEQLSAELADQLDLGPLGALPAIALEEALPQIIEALPPELIDESGAIALLPPTVGADQLAVGTRTANGVDVIVTASTEGIDLTVDRVRTALWATVPFAIALTALVTWLLAGRALRPVRAITDRTSRITAGTLHERVPVPSSQDEVSALATVMNGMLDRLQREDTRRRQFIADASHELRSPIAAIQTQAEVALREAGEADAEELASGVLSEAVRLGSIVDDLLSIARHDEALAPPGAVVDLDDIVLAEAERQRRVDVDTSRVSAGRVRGRADELNRVVTHLLDNAARHADDQIQVTLTTTDDDTVVLEVADDGPGVPDADRDRIFERFVRLDEARERDAGGAGLGLAVVATVIAAAGGSITVGRSDLGGACFRVTLPAAA